MATDLALAIHIGMAAAVRRPQVHAQPQFARRVGGRQEFVASLAPDAIEQRRDGQRGGDAVADQLREGIALLEGQFGGGVHLVRPLLHVGFRPDAALAPGGRIVETQDGRVQVRQRVQVHEARADHCAAVVMAARDLPRIAMADIDDAVAFEDDFAVLVQAVPPVFMADHPAGSQQDRAFGGAHQGASTSARPSRATTRPRLTTNLRTGRDTIASATVSASTSTKSAWQPGARP